MKSNEIRPTVAILYLSASRSIQAPLVPDFICVYAPEARLMQATMEQGSPPNVECDGVALADAHRLLQRNKEGEPAEHAWSVCGGEDGQGDVGVQHGVEVACHAVHHHAHRRRRERDALVPAHTSAPSESQQGGTWCCR